MKKTTIGILAVLFAVVCVTAGVLIATIPTTVTVSEGLSTTTVSESVSCFPNEDKVITIPVHNNGAVSVHGLFSWVETSNPNAVTYSTDLSKTVVLASGDNNVDVNIHCNEDSLVGVLTADITIDRVA